MNADTSTLAGVLDRTASAWTSRWNVPVPEALLGALPPAVEAAVGGGGSPGHVVACADVIPLLADTYAREVRRVYAVNPPREVTIRATLEVFVEVASGRATVEQAVAALTRQVESGTLPSASGGDTRTTAPAPVLSAEALVAERLGGVVIARTSA